LGITESINTTRIIYIDEYLALFEILIVIADWNPSLLTIIQVYRQITMGVQKKEKCQANCKDYAHAKAWH